MEYTDHYDSPLGGVTLASDGIALTGLWFDGQRYFAAALSPEHEKRALPVFDQTREWLDLYFSGRQPDFTPLLQLKGTPFQLAVWEALLAIPYGATVTYGDIARTAAGSLGLPRTSARAAGGAVSRNPISLIVPCHRVVGSSGLLTGYAGGLKRKQLLLSLEKNGVSGLSTPDDAIIE